jgi:hypothetical protein
MPATSSKQRIRSSTRSPHAHPFLTERQQISLILKESVESPPAPIGSQWMVIAVFLCAGIVLPIYAHTKQFGFSPIQASLAFFLVLNVLICMWEISLGLHITYADQIRLFYAFFVATSCSFSLSATFIRHLSQWQQSMALIVCAVFLTFSLRLSLRHNCSLASSGPGYGPLTVFTTQVTATEKRKLLDLHLQYGFGML